MLRSLKCRLSFTIYDLTIELHRAHSVVGFGEGIVQLGVKEGCSLSSYVSSAYMDISRLRMELRLQVNGWWSNWLEFAGRGDDNRRRWGYLGFFSLNNWFK